MGKYLGAMGTTNGTSLSRGQARLDITHRMTKNSIQEICLAPTPEAETTIVTTSGEDQYADRQLPVELRANRHPGALKSAHHHDSALKSGPPAESIRVAKRIPEGLWLVVGSAVADYCLDGGRLTFGERTIGFDGPAGREVVAHRGPQMRPGEKRTATDDLSPVLARLSVRPKFGGGCVHTSRMLAWLLVEHGLGGRIRVIDTGSPWAELRAEIEQAGADYRALKLTGRCQNLILTTGWDRVVIRSTAVPASALHGEGAAVLSGVGSALEAVLVNSPRSEETARAAVMTGIQCGASIYSVATPSLPLDVRIKLLLRYSRMTVFNLTEFCELAELVGVACPAEECAAFVPSIARALGDFCQIVPCGIVVITLGEVGMIIRNSRAIAHLGLTDVAREKIGGCLGAADRNGLGDRIFAALAVADQLLTTKLPSEARIIVVGCQAWMDVLRRVSSTLNPDVAWFTVRNYGRRSVSEFACDMLPAQFRNVSWGTRASNGTRKHKVVS